MSYETTERRITYSHGVNKDRTQTGYASFPMIQAYVENLTMGPVVVTKKETRTVTYGDWETARDLPATDYWTAQTPEFRERAMTHLAVAERTHGDRQRKRAEVLNDAIGNVLDRWWESASWGDTNIVYDDAEACLDDIWLIVSGLYRPTGPQPKRPFDPARERIRMSELRAEIDRLKERP